MFGLKLLGLLVMTLGQPATPTGPDTVYVGTDNRAAVPIGSSEPNEPWPRFDMLMSSFEIGTKEVSITEYTAFLNAVEGEWQNTLSKVMTDDGRYIIGLVPTGISPADQPSAECINFLTALADEGFDFEDTDLIELITVRSFADQADAAPIIYNPDALLTGNDAFTVDGLD